MFLILPILIFIIILIIIFISYLNPFSATRYNAKYAASYDGGKKKKKRPKKKKKLKKKKVRRGKKSSSNGSSGSSSSSFPPPPPPLPPVTTAATTAATTTTATTTTATATPPATTAVTTTVTTTTAVTSKAIPVTTTTAASSPSSVTPIIPAVSAPSGPVVKIVKKEEVAEDTSSEIIEKTADKFVNDLLLGIIQDTSKEIAEKNTVSDNDEKQQIVSTTTTTTTTPSNQFSTPYNPFLRPSKENTDIEKETLKQKILKEAKGKLTNDKKMIKDNSVYNFIKNLDNDKVFKEYLERQPSTKLLKNTNIDKDETISNFLEKNNPAIDLWVNYLMDNQTIQESSILPITKRPPVKVKELAKTLKKKKR